jgi:hypothetical protein
VNVPKEKILGRDLVNSTYIAGIYFSNLRRISDSMEIKMNKVNSRLQAYFWTGMRAISNHFEASYKGAEPALQL